MAFLTKLFHGSQKGRVLVAAVSASAPHTLMPRGLPVEDSSSDDEIHGCVAALGCTA
jgi:hypothetical protein